MVGSLRTLDEPTVKRVIAAPGGDFVFLQIEDELVGLDLDGVRTGVSMKVGAFHLFAAAARTRRFALLSGDVVRVYDATCKPILEATVQARVRGLAFDRTGTVLFVAACDNRVHGYWLDEGRTEALSIDWLPATLLSQQPSVHEGHAQYGSHCCFLVTDWDRDHTVALWVVAACGRGDWGGYTRFMRLTARETLEPQALEELRDPLVPLHLGDGYAAAHTLQEDCSDQPALYLGFETLDVDAWADHAPGCAAETRFAVYTHSGLVHVFDRVAGKAVPRCTLPGMTMTLLGSDRAILGGTSNVEIWSI